MLELAILGLLHDSPMHGYELRKQLHLVMGTMRTLSYGTLYPRLRELVHRGWIHEVPDTALVRRPASGLSAGRRARITYELTADGKERFGELLEQAGPAAWEDGTFDVHFAFFGRTNSDVRLRILEGRRSRLEERLQKIRESDSPGGGDAYTAELHRHGLESAEREVRWLAGLIESERSGHYGTTRRPLDTNTENKE
jgi:DNA-binding PadR family transcriptional regulator